MDIQGSGRTDAGVHARAQVAHLRVRPPKESARRNWPRPDEILRAINSRLPSDVCLLDVAEAPRNFHARHDAVARTYMYQISTRRTAFFKKYVWWVREPLDVAAMAQAARLLIGRHDFRAFRAEDPARPDESPIVVVEDAGIEVDGDLIVFRITASHFLWRMVRRIVGVLARLGRAEITRGRFCRFVRRQNKSHAGCCGVDRARVGAFSRAGDLSRVVAIRALGAALMVSGSARVERHLRPSR